MEINSGEKTMIITDENGEEREVEILFTYHNEERGKDYVLFFEKEYPDDIIAMIFNDEGELIPIEDDEEFAEVEEVLDAFDNDEQIQEAKEEVEESDE